MVLGGRSEIQLQRYEDLSQTAEGTSLVVQVVKTLKSQGNRHGSSFPWGTKRDGPTIIIIMEGS